MEHRGAAHNQYAYKRQPSNQVYTSTFNPHLPSGHTSSIKQFQGNPYAPAIVSYNGTAVADPPSTSSTEASSTSESGSLLSNFNLASLTKYANVDEIKGLVDRFGGLDGILATVTKVQKVMSTVGQIAPMAKVFGGIMGNRKQNADTQETDRAYVPARRRKQVAKRNMVRAKGRKVQVNKQTSRTKRSKVYTNTNLR